MKNIENVASYKMRLYSYLASITIVMLHGTYYFARGSAGTVNWSHTFQENMISFFGFVGTLSMGWFFFSSSYFFFRSYSTENYPKTMGKKIRTLLIPYVLWNALYIIYDFLVYLRVGKVQFDIVETIKGFLFFYWPGETMIAPANLPLWYVIRIFTYFLSAPLIYILVKNKKVWFVVQIISTIMIYWFKIEYYSYFYWLPVFLYGAGIVIHFKDKAESYIAGNGANRSNGILLTIYFLVALFLFLFDVDVTIRRYIGLLLAFIMLHHMRVDIDKKIPKVGESTMLYFSHFMVLNFVSRVFSILDLYSNTVIIYIVYIVLTALIVEIAGKILKNYFGPIYLILMGGR